MPVNSFENYPMSWKPQLDSAKKPIYIALATLLKDDISSGSLPPGTKLPPQRELADYLDVNLSTITRAFKLCEEKGLICSSVGRGTYVSSDALSNNMINILEPNQNHIEMGAILPNPDINYIISSLLKDMTKEPDFYKVLQYNPFPYNDYQIKAAKKWLSYLHINATRENILYSNGSQNAIFSVLSSVFKRGDKIATMSITYPGLKIAANILGIQLIAIPTYDNRITRQSLEYVKNNHNITGFYFIPDYNNPTNEIMDLSTRKLIADFAESNQCPVIEDAIYSLFIPNPLQPIASFAKNYGILISSVSKVMSPGLRLAIMYVPKHFHQTITQCLYAMQITPPALNMQIFARLVSLDLFHEIRNLRISEITERYELLLHTFEFETIDAHKYSPICWLHLPDDVNPDSFEQLMNSKNVHICSASRFMVGIDSVPNAVRISLISENSIERFKEGLHLLKESIYT